MLDRILEQVKCAAGTVEVCVQHVTMHLPQIVLQFLLEFLYKVPLLFLGLYLIGLTPDRDNWTLYVGLATAKAYNQSAFHD